MPDSAIMCRLFGHRRQINMSQMFSGALMTCARCDYRSPGRRTYLFGSLRVENGSTPTGADDDR